MHDPADRQGNGGIIPAQLNAFLTEILCRFQQLLILPQGLHHRQELAPAEAEHPGTAFRAPQQ